MFSALSKYRVGSPGKAVQDPKFEVAEPGNGFVVALREWRRMPHTRHLKYISAKCMVEVVDINYRMPCPVFAIFSVPLALSRDINSSQF